MQNKTLIEAGRNILRSLLHRATPEQQLLFKRMYYPKDLYANIDHVIDNMDVNKIDWAITQCEQSIK